MTPSVTRRTFLKGNAAGLLALGLAGVLGLRSRGQHLDGHDHTH